MRSSSCIPTALGLTFESVTQEWCNKNCFDSLGMEIEACDHEHGFQLCACEGDDKTYVNAPWGSYTGSLESYKGQQHRAYRGIPYAEAPIGDLRFRAPIPKAPSNVTFHAGEYGAICPQIDEQLPLSVMSEDCLFLNVFAPLATKSQSLPVLVWIHGGAFITGAGSDYHGGAYPSRGVILITINYRLAALGNFAHPDLALNDYSGSNGGVNSFRDQQLALRWVQENIASFGGDPESVTVFGESAGGTSVCSQMCSPLSEGMFKRAIIQSGSCVSAWAMVDEAEGLTTSQAWMESLGATSIDEIRQIDWPELILMGADTFNLMPSVDGVVMPKHTRDIMRENGTIFGDSNQVMIGLTTLDGLAGDPFNIYGPAPATDEEYKLALEAVFEEDWEKVYAVYPPTDRPDIVITEINRDCCLTCGVREMISLYQTFDTPDVYAYLFSQCDSNNYDPGQFNLAGHAAELPNLFQTGRGNPTTEMFCRGGAYSEEISDAMIDYWTNFAKTGSPGIVGGVEWERWDPSFEQHLNFSQVLTLEEGMYTSNCDFWDNYVQSDIALARRDLFCNLPWGTIA